MFAQRNGIVQGFVLVDSEQDRVYATTGENNWDDRLRMFELDKVSEIRRVRLPQLRRVLSYFERPCRACVYLRRPRSFVSLRSFVGDSYGRDSGVATAYIFIVARWCAFCQRVLPMYERYIARLQQDCVGVLVDEVHVDDMPEWLESRVEGYPTVLRIVRDVHGVAVMDVTDGLDLGPEHV